MLKPLLKRGAAPLTSLSEFTQPSAGGSLKLLSFNIQVGIETDAYHHYLTKSWQHLLPHGKRNVALARIAQIMSHFDLVAIQEADGGSWRSGNINQVEYLAKHGGFPYWYQQINRNLGRIAQHSNGALSRLLPTKIEKHRLPGLMPGRGAMVLHFGSGEDALVVVIMHLALSRNGQNRQLAYVRDLIAGHKNVVLMGDMNTHAQQLLEASPLKELALQPVVGDLKTFPSWKPTRGLDHILVSDSVQVNKVAVLDTSVSDHLPIAMEIQLPDSVQRR